jgi:hypothetical protein
MDLQILKVQGSGYLFGLFVCGENKRVFIPWDYELDMENNHIEAVKKAISKLELKPKILRLRFSWLNVGCVAIPTVVESHYIADKTMNVGTEVDV